MAGAGNPGRDPILEREERPQIQKRRRERHDRIGKRQRLLSELDSVDAEAAIRKAWMSGAYLGKPFPGMMVRACGLKDEFTHRFR